MNLNLKVDEIKGFQKIVDSSTRQCGDHWEYPYPSDNEEPYYVGPDYQNDWNYLGPLVLELGLAEWEYDVLYAEGTSHHRWVKKSNFINKSVDFILNKDFSKATCLAYLRHKGVECEY